MSRRVHCSFFIHVSRCDGALPSLLPRTWNSSCAQEIPGVVQVSFVLISWSFRKLFSQLREASPLSQPVARSLIRPWRKSLKHAYIALFLRIRWTRNMEELLPTKIWQPVEISRRRMLLQQRNVDPPGQCQLQYCVLQKIWPERTYCALLLDSTSFSWACYKMR